jgi:hypothetical protein
MEANLTGVRNLTNEKVHQHAYSLKGATMPYGKQKFEDWRKDREDSKEDAENG